MKKCFWAYSDKGHKVSSSINEAVEQLNKTDMFSITTWEVMGVDGRSIPNSVTTHIDNCDTFICDTTNFNENVLFELGYAIAKNKQVWIFVNPSVEGTDKALKAFDLIGSVGYTKYNNSHDLISKLWELIEQPGVSLLDDLTDRSSIASTKNILYMKSIFALVKCFMKVYYHELSIA